MDMDSPISDDPNHGSGAMPEQAAPYRFQTHHHAQTDSDAALHAHRQFIAIQTLFQSTAGARRKERIHFETPEGFIDPDAVDAIASHRGLADLFVLVRLPQLITPESSPSAATPGGPTPLSVMPPALLTAAKPLAPFFHRPPLHVPVHAYPSAGKLPTMHIGKFMVPSYRVSAPVGDLTPVSPVIATPLTVDYGIAMARSAPADASLKEPVRFDIDIDNEIELTDTRPPRFTSPTSDMALEDQNVLYTAVAVDSDIGAGPSNPVTYAVSGTDAALLAIDSVTGIITLTSGNLDYETKNSYSFTVEATDAAGNASHIAIDVEIVSPPVNTFPPSISVAQGDTFSFTGGDSISAADVENNLVRFYVMVEHGTLNVTLNGGASFELGGNGTSQFRITGTQAEINATLATLVYQPADGYYGEDTLTIISRDTVGLVDTDTLAITVIPVPVLTSGPLVSNAGVTFTVTDGTVGESLNYLAPFTGFGAIHNGAASTLSASAQPTLTAGALAVEDHTHYSVSLGLYLGLGTTGADELNTVGTDSAALYGFGGGDTLNGGTANDFLFGGNGADALYGGDGDDVLEGGADADVLSGGSGSNIYVFNTSDNTGSDEIVFNTAAGATESIRVDSDSILTGLNGNGALTGLDQIILNGDGVDLTLHAGHIPAHALQVIGYTDSGTAVETLIVEGTAAANAISLEALVVSHATTIINGGGGDDIITASSVSDTINGGTGSDTITGGDGDDIINGDAGEDIVNGGLGNDTISGGANVDVMTGGGGDDTFVHVTGAATNESYTPSGNKLTPQDGDTVSNIDIITDINTGDRVIFGNADIAPDAGILGTLEANEYLIVQGHYDAGTETFTVASGGEDSMVALDGSSGNGVTAEYFVILGVNHAEAVASGFDDVANALVFNNAPPSALAFANELEELSDTTSTVTRIKVADIVITDDGEGSNVLTLSGTDADYFEIAGLELFLQAGVTLDYDTHPVLDVTVTVDDVTAVGHVPISSNYSLEIVDPKTPNNALPPSPQTLNEDETLALTGALVIQVTDSEDNLSNVVLGANHGNLNVTAAGAVVVAGNNTNNLTLSGGTQADLNATLATLNYSPSANHNGSDNLIITSEDALGRNDSDTLALSITPVNDAPTLTQPVNATASALTFTVNDVDTGDTLSLQAPFAALGTVNNGSLTTLLIEQQSSVLAGNLIVQDAHGGTVDTGVYLAIGTSGSNTLTAPDTRPGMLYGFGIADTLIGGSMDDTLTGGNGTDTIIGGDGNDTISGGNNADSIDGGSGDNTYLYNSNQCTSGESIAFNSTGLETIRIDSTTDLHYLNDGEALSDLDRILLTGTNTDATFSSTQLSGMIITISGMNSDHQLLIEGSAIADTIDLSWLTLTNVTTTISGLGGADTITGSSVNDTITGGNGNDIIRGHSGADSMTGNAGTDRYIHVTGDASAVHYTSVGGSPLAPDTGDLVSQCDIINDLITGESIQFGNATLAGPDIDGTLDANEFMLLQGSYATGVFTAGGDTANTLLLFDGSSAAGVQAEYIILVGVNAAEAAAAGFAVGTQTLTF